MAERKKYMACVEATLSQDCCVRAALLKVLIKVAKPSFFSPYCAMRRSNQCRNLTIMYTYNAVQTKNMAMYRKYDFSPVTMPAVVPA